VETVSADGTLRVWAQSGSPLGAAGPARTPYVMGAVIPGGFTTLAARKDGAIDVWRSAEAKGREFFATRHGARFIPGSARIATCAGILDVGADGRIAGGESVHADAAQVWGVAVSPDGRLIATSAHDGAVRLRDATTFAEIRTLRASGPLAWAVAFDPAGRRVAACCGNDVVIWDVGGGGRVGGAADSVGVLTGHASAVSAVAFDPARPRIITTSADGEARVWDSATLAPMGLLHRAPAALRDIAFSRDGSALAVACDDGTVLVWRSVLDVTDLPVHPESTLDAGAGAVWAVAFDPAGELLAAGTERSAVTLFSAAAGERLATLRADVGRVRALSFDDTGRRLAAGCYVTASILWDLPALRESLREAGVDWDDPRR
jgi:WD40 repeat protein